MGAPTSRTMLLLGAVGGAGAVLASSPGSALGQGSVRSARMVADLSRGDSTATVRLEYVLDGVSAGGRLGLSALRFGTARVEEVRSGRDAVMLRALPGLAAAGVVTAEGADADTVRVAVTYRVRTPVRRDSNGTLRGYVPVLSLDLPPEEARPGLFRAEVLLPASWTLSEAFPTGLRPVSDTSGGSRGWAVDLPVVPSVVSFRAHPDARWHPGLPLLLDLSAGAILALFGVVGWGHLRRVAR